MTLCDKAPVKIGMLVAGIAIEQVLNYRYLEQYTLNMVWKQESQKP